MKASQKIRRPLKAEFRHLSRATVVALINAFGKIRSLECLRETGNFRHCAWIDPIRFDEVDQYVALRYVIDAVNAAASDESMVELGKRLTHHLGVLEAPIAVGLGRYGFVIQPHVWWNTARPH